MKRLFVFALVVLSGCGPSYQDQRERSLSELNLMAAKWDGTINPPNLEGRVDPWGTPYAATVDKDAFNYVLVVRSAGYDTLLMNNDDISVCRIHQHTDVT